MKKPICQLINLWSSESMDQRLTQIMHMTLYTVNQAVSQSHAQSITESVK